MISVRFSMPLIALVIALSPAPEVRAAESDRTGKWDLLLELNDVAGKTISFDGGTSARTKNSVGFGLGLAYNFNEHWALGGDIVWNSIDYDATIYPAPGNPGAPFSGSGTADTSTFNINGTYNILATALTPFVTGGIGATYIDTNIPTGPAVPVCWWYPWWGYYCGGVVPTKTDTVFTYNVGAGVRWDITRGFFMRGLVSRQWFDIGGAAGTPGFTSYRLDAGFRF